MRISASAGRWLALACFLSLPLAGCGNPSDARAINALVARLMDILAPAEDAPRAGDLEGIFTDLDPSRTLSSLASLEALPPDPDWSILELKFLPFGSAAVTVELRSEGATSTLALKAKKADGEWRLDPVFNVRQKLDEVRLQGP